MKCRWILAILLFAALTDAARADDRPTVIVVIGAEGTAEYGAEFNKDADRWADAARKGSANCVIIGRDTSKDKIDKQRFKEAIDAQASETVQQLWIVMIGHGTFDGKEAKFNLRDDDFSDAELAAWLKPFKRPIAVIDCSSSSAPFLNKLSAPGRVIITATRSGSEVNYCRFGEYMSVAIADPSADLDKDGQTSLLEAFLAASHRTADFYKDDGRLATEHALIDDNGDGMGTSADFFQGVRATRAARGGASVDGARAHQWHLIRSAAEEALPAEVRKKRDELELKIDALRGKKTTMMEEEYYRELDGMLVELAKIYEGVPGK